jgi:hypothetical protein
MKLVLYHENRIIQVLEHIRAPSVDGSDIFWENGAVSDASHFVLLQDDVDISNGLTDEILSFDQRLNFIKPVSSDEMNALAIMELAELVLGGGV